MIITQVRGSNFMGLNVVDVEFDPGQPITTVGGANCAGKSSFIKLMSWALGGKKQLGTAPVRKGSAKANVAMELIATDEELAAGFEYDGLRIQRSITTEGAETFKVVGMDGKKYPTPQSILDRLLGPLSFDPMVFAHRSDQRIKILRDISGVDTSDVDKRLAAAIEERRSANVLLRNVQERALSAHEEIPPGTPSTPVDIGSIIAEQQAAEEHNRLTVAECAKRDDEDKKLEGWRTRLAELQEEMDVIERQITVALEVRASREELDGLEDLEVFREALRTAAATNEAVARRTAARKLAEEADRANTTAGERSEEVKRLEAEREEMVKQASAAIAIEGLTWQGEDIYYDGVPFDDCATTEQTIVSCQLQTASHRDLPVMFVPNAAMLLPENRAIIAQAAMAAGCHVVMEVPGDSNATLVVEGGKVASRK